jgi:hypothetical protein
MMVTMTHSAYSRLLPRALQQLATARSPLGCRSGEHSPQQQQEHDDNALERPQFYDVQQQQQHFNDVQALPELSIPAVQYDHVSPQHSR